MECDTCGADIEGKGLLITTGTIMKEWACTDCFVTALIKGRADIVHHWGFNIEEFPEEPKPEPE